MSEIDDIPAETISDTDDLASCKYTCSSQTSAA